MGAALALPQPAKAGPDGRIGGSTDVGAAAAQSAEVSGPQFWNSEARPQRPDPRSQASERARWPIPTHAPSQSEGPGEQSPGPFAAVPGRHDPLHPRVTANAGVIGSKALPVDGIGPDARLWATCSLTERRSSGASPSTVQLSRRRVGTTSPATASVVLMPTARWAILRVGLAYAAGCPDLGETSGSGMYRDFELIRNKRVRHVQH